MSAEKLISVGFTEQIVLKKKIEVLAIQSFLLFSCLLDFADYCDYDYYSCCFFDVIILVAVPFFIAFRSVFSSLHSNHKFWRIIFVSPVSTPIFLSSSSILVLVAILSDTLRNSCSFHVCCYYCRLCYVILAFEKY